MLLGARVLFKRRSVVYYSAIVTVAVGKVAYSSANPPIDPPKSQGEFVSPETPNPNVSLHNYVAYKKSGFRSFILTRDYVAQTNIIGHPISFKTSTYSINLDEKGVMTISAGYKWNGPTGFPSLDSMMRGSCVHDITYTLFSKRVNVLDREKVKLGSDQLLRQMFIDDGCPVWLADAAFVVVQNISWIAEWFASVVGSNN